MHYFIGDIHGYLDQLIACIEKIRGEMKESDRIVFLGDYIDRGPMSYEVVDYLISFSKKHDSVFLKGNHEAMFLDYVAGNDKSGIYLNNGGTATIKSYRKNLNEFKIPEKHMDFYRNLRLYYEGDDFIAVHAGLNPKIDQL